MGNHENREKMGENEESVDIYAGKEVPEFAGRVDDVEKARAMAIAGNKYRGLAAESSMRADAVESGEDNEGLVEKTMTDYKRDRETLLEDMKQEEARMRAEGASLEEIREMHRKYKELKDALYNPSEEEVRAGIAKNLRRHADQLNDVAETKEEKAGSEYDDWGMVLD